MAARFSSSISVTGRARGMAVVDALDAPKALRQIASIQDIINFAGRKRRLLREGPLKKVYLAYALLGLIVILLLFAQLARTGAPV